MSRLIAATIRGNCDQRTPVRQGDEAHLIDFLCWKSLAAGQSPFNAAALFTSMDMANDAGRVALSLALRILC